MSKKMGRPKLTDEEKLLRKGKRVWQKLKEVEELYDADPTGPTTPGSPGRPPVKYKDQVARLRLEYAEIKDKLKTDAWKSGSDKRMKDVEHRIYETEVGDAGTGRPKALEAQKIEYKIRQKEQRIQRIKNGDEKGSGKKSESGKVIGRKVKDSEVKIARLEDQMLAMKAQVREIMKNMSADEKEDLEIRRLRRIAAKLRESLREKGLDELRIEAHKNWEAAKSDRDTFTVEVLETVALERQIDERATKLRNSGYKA